MRGTTTRAMAMRALACAGALATLLLHGCDVDGADFRPLAAGSPAPTYTAPTLAGDTVSLAELRGEAVLLNVWATWCAPCRREMPALQAAHEAWADEGLRVVGASIDRRTAAGQVRDFVQDHGITFTILHDAGSEVTRRFRTAGVPETFLIDREGTIVHRWIGEFDPTGPEAAATIRETLES
jgi:cytochrome c biogenesis protein CcmG, thiol:disulfide interchange protein DsbE